MKNHKNILTQFIKEIWNNGNFEELDEWLAPTYTIFHDPGDPYEGKTLDLNTFKERVNLSRQAFPDQHFDIVDMIEENNKIAMSWILTGTHRGNIPGLTVTNNKIKISGLTIYYFSNDKISGHRQVIDRLSAYQQLNAKG